MSMKNSNDTIGNRTRDLPACSAVPQPTAPPRAPVIEKWWEDIQTFGSATVLDFAIEKDPGLIAINFHPHKLSH
jgi:glutamine amidotransferase PdxT